VTAAVRIIILDIEGTTTPIAFVYETLFPYARARLRSFLEAHTARPDVVAILERLRHERAADPEASQDDSEAIYLEWLMDRDRKSTPLKDLQGLIWAAGYENAELIGALFPDVAPALRAWNENGIDVGIFSSGSILAQQLLFRHSTEGDLTPLIRWHFDTTTGPKTAPESYRRIVGTIGVPGKSIMFVSDVVSELDAARAAGMQTALSKRPGNRPVVDEHGHRVIDRFEELVSRG
jgi:enolase-phosphatase E1